MTMPQKPTTFDLSKSMMNLKKGGKSSKYLEVKWRLLWFREVCPMGTIETRLIHLDAEAECEEEVDLLVWDQSLDNGEGGWKKVWNNEKHAYEKTIKRAKGYAVVQATVTDGQGNTATGLKMERAVSFADYLEKAETGAIGRALAALGYGTQFAGNEVREGRVVDSPVSTNERTRKNTEQAAPAPARQAPANNPPVAPAAPVAASKTPAGDSPVTSEQIAAIRKLAIAAKRTVKPPKTYADAEKLLAELKAG